MIKSARAIVAMSVLAIGNAVAAAPANTGLMEKVDAFVRAEMEREKVPGVAVAIVNHGEVILAKGYGLSNVELRVPVTAETMFQSGSVGKQFTSAAVMLQVQDGKLGLD